MDVIRFEGEALDDLMVRFRNLAIDHSMGEISSVSVAVDGGLKVKVIGHRHSSTWTPPLGTAQ